MDLIKTDPAPQVVDATPPTIMDTALASEQEP